MPHHDGQPCYTTASGTSILSVDENIKKQKRLEYLRTNKNIKRQESLAGHNPVLSTNNSTRIEFELNRARLHFDNYLKLPIPGNSILTRHEFKLAWLLQAKFELNEIAKYFKSTPLATKKHLQKIADKYDRDSISRIYIENQVNSLVASNPIEKQNKPKFLGE